MRSACGVSGRRTVPSGRRLVTRHCRPGGIVYLDVRDLDSRDAYRLLIGSVVPRPIAWVSTVSASGNGRILAEVLAYHIGGAVFDAERRRSLPERLKAIGRMAGDGYSRTREYFEMVRPDPNYRGR